VEAFTAISGGSAIPWAAIKNIYCHFLEEIRMNDSVDFKFMPN